MKSRFILLVLVLVLSLSSLISIINASSITRDYDADFSIQYVHTTQTYLTFHVKMIIETEADGNWKPNTYYQIDYIISLIYLNESVINTQGFSYLFFYNPMLLVNDFIFGTGDFQIVTNYTSVWSGHTGIETLKYSIKGGDRIQLKAMLNYQIFNTNDTAFIQSADWVSTEPIWIDIESVGSSSPDYITPLLYIAIGVVIAVVPTAIYLIYKSRNGKTKDKTVQHKELASS